MNTSKTGNVKYVAFCSCLVGKRMACNARKCEDFRLSPLLVLGIIMSQSFFFFCGVGGSNSSTPLVIPQIWRSSSTKSNAGKWASAVVRRICEHEQRLNISPSCCHCQTCSGCVQVHCVLGPTVSTAASSINVHCLAEQHVGSLQTRGLVLSQSEQNQAITRQTWF